MNPVFTVLKIPIVPLDESPDEPQPRSIVGTSLSSDFEALRNDFEQASELAADFQRQLCGKSNEYAALKHLFEKTSQDFNKLQIDIATLREERHNLANQAMRSDHFEYLLGKTADENALLKAQIATLTTHSEAQTRRIASLNVELDAARHSVPAHDPLQSKNSTSLLNELVKSVNQLRRSIENPSERINVTPFRSAPTAPQNDFINLSYVQ